MAIVHIQRHTLADLHADPPRPVEEVDVETPDPDPPPATLSDTVPKRPSRRGNRATSEKEGPARDEPHKREFDEDDNDR
jgi:hypothetical protein